MSFEANDMNTIHLGNYEEFFILYLDNELSEQHMKMVDQFLLSNPDLRAEFEILASTKLPLEEVSFDKKDLLAENLKLSSIDEELLLYIDNELPADKNKTVEFELKSNKDYQRQHQVLLQTKLDSSEKIIYPNKKELYHRTERIISIKVWMRVAAAVVIVALGGVVYFKNPPSITPTTGEQTTAGTTNTPAPDSGEQKEPLNTVVVPSEAPPKNDLAANEGNNKIERKQTKVVNTKDENEDTPVEKNLIAVVNPEEKNDNLTERNRVNVVQSDVNNNTPTISKDNLNTGSVTNLNPDRTTIKGPDEPLAQTDNDRKGSLKGFLRKATRVIEKRTGIDPTNSNGELLIGAVAINLK